MSRSRRALSQKWSILEKRIEKAEATATKYEKLLREANYFLEYIPIGIEGEEERYHKLMEELAKELKDE